MKYLAFVKQTRCSRCLLFLLLVITPGLIMAQPVVVTPGSSAAYVFCPKSKDECPPKTKLGRWKFKLRSADDADLPADKKSAAFKAGSVVGVSVTWATIQNRWYVGYGEFTIDPADKTRGTFSGFVDLPPQAGLQNEYCTIAQASTNNPKNTPLRTCPLIIGSAGGINTGVVECPTIEPPATMWRMTNGAFGALVGEGAGYCVAHFVRKRLYPGESDNSACGSTYGGCLYQARVFNLQIREAADFDP